MSNSQSLTRRATRAIATSVACVAVVAAVAGCGRSAASMSASARIGEKGGIVRLADGASVVVPPLAFTGDTTVRIRHAASQASRPAPATWAPAGAQYAIDFGAAPPRIPAVVDLPFSGGTGASNGAFLAHYDPQLDGWTPAGATTDAAQRGLTAQAAQGSVWEMFTPARAGTETLVDRSIVTISSPDGADTLRLCPYIADSPENPCASTIGDDQLDPIDLVFYGLTDQQITSTLSPFTSGWNLDPGCWWSDSHAVYAAAGSGGFARYAISHQSYQPALAGGCMNPLDQFHLRLFRITGTPWVIAAAHEEQILVKLAPPGHQPSGPWEGAEHVVAASFSASGFGVSYDSMLLQHDCTPCQFRGQTNNGYATLITPPGVTWPRPDVAFNPPAAPVGAHVSVTVSGFPANAQILLYGDAGRTNVFLDSQRVDANGSLTFDEVVPTTYASAYGQYPVPPGVYPVRAQALDEPRTFADRTFEVTPGGAGSLTGPGYLSGPGQLSRPGSGGLPEPGRPSRPGRPGPPPAPAATPVPQPSVLSRPGGIASPTQVPIPPTVALPTLVPPTPLSGPGGLAGCPPVLSGHWSGGWSSATGPYGGTWGTDMSVVSVGQLRGSVVFNGSISPSGDSLAGTVSCNQVAVLDLDSGARFTGTLSADGRTVSGAYTSSSDHGTWSGSLQ